MGGKVWLQRVMYFTILLENCLVLARSLSILELFLSVLVLTVLPGGNHRANSVEHPGVIHGIQRENDGAEILLQ